MTTPAPTDPFAAFAVGRRPESALAEMVQRLGPGLTDHRGLIDLPALAVLFDDIGGLPFFVAEPGPSMQSRVSMSMLDRPTVDDELDARASVRLASGMYGVTDVEIAGPGGLVCTGTARNVRVGRELVVDGDHMAIPFPAAPGAASVPAPAAELSGAEIVDRIAHGDLPIGAVGELLNTSLNVQDSGITVRCTTAPWMGNIMGTMHGGVIAAVTAQAMSLAAQSLTSPGQDYLLSEFSAAFLRSPAVDGRTVHVVVEPIKVGRRLSFLQARMHDGETLLAHAVADARMDLRRG